MAWPNVKITKETKFPDPPLNLKKMSQILSGGVDAFNKDYKSWLKYQAKKDPQGYVMLLKEIHRDLYQVEAHLHSTNRLLYKVHDWIKFDNINRSFDCDIYKDVLQGKALQYFTNVVREQRVLVGLHLQQFR